MCKVCGWVKTICKIRRCVQTVCDCAGRKACLKDALQVMGGSEREMAVNGKKIGSELTKRQGDGPSLGARWRQNTRPAGRPSFMARGNAACMAARKHVLPRNTSAVKAELGFLPVERTPLAARRS